MDPYKNQIRTQEFKICRLYRLMMAPWEPKHVVMLYFNPIKTQFTRWNGSELFLFIDCCVWQVYQNIIYMYTHTVMLYAVFCAYVNVFSLVLLTWLRFFVIFVTARIVLSNGPWLLPSKPLRTHHSQSSYNLI
jgi:hypothetical protein